MLFLGLVDAKEIEEKMLGDFTAVPIYLLGEPENHYGHFLRWRRHGHSLVTSHLAFLHLLKALLWS